MCSCLFCSWLIFEPRYSNNDELSKNLINSIRQNIEDKINNSQTRDQDKSLLTLALKAYDIISSYSCIRRQLVRFRNELDYYKANTGLSLIYC